METGEALRLAFEKFADPRRRCRSLNSKALHRENPNPARAAPGPTPIAGRRCRRTILGNAGGPGVACLRKIAAGGLPTYNLPAAG